jgi:hypothetical protein
MEEIGHTNRTTKFRYLGEKLKCWNLPERRTHFTGREDLIIQLQQALFRANARILVYGLAGSGKTALVGEYANRNYDRYSHIFWLEIEGTTEYQIQLKDIITELEIKQEEKQECEDAFIDWLSDQQDWLLIIDGYQNSEKIKKFWSKTLNGKLLVTASMKITEVEFDANTAIEVRCMENQEATAFLKKHTLPADYEVTPATEKAIQTLERTFGGLPQALLESVCLAESCR